MSLNWKEIDAVLDELDLVDSRVQKIRQPNFRELILDLYRPGNRRSLLISLEQGKTRLHAIETSISNDVKLQRFAQLLRSRITGGVITRAAQLGEDRIIEIGIDRPEARTTLFLRLWSGAANIVAVDEHGVVLDAFFRRPNRGEISGQRFSPNDAVDAAPKRKHREFSIRDFPGDGSLNRRIETWYRDSIETTELDSLRDRLLRNTAKSINRMEAQREDLERRIEETETGDDYKRYGDLISSNLYRITDGADRVKVEDFYHEGREIEIELDPSLNGGENADRYYRRYKKAARRRERLVEELSVLTRRFDELSAQRCLIESLDGIEHLDELKTIAEKLTPEQHSGDTGGSDLPGLRFDTHGFTIYVGRTSKENDALLRHHVRGNDYWMHTRDTPGGYVFIKAIRGKSIPLEVLLDAGNLAVHFSKSRSSGRADLFYTQVKHLRRAKNGPEGLVLPTQEKNLAITVESSRLARLLG